MNAKERPAIVEDCHLDYLDKLRKSGRTNMYGAGPYIRRAFSVDEKQSHDILGYWMATYPRAAPGKNGEH